MKALNRNHCFGCGDDIWCGCRGKTTRFCPIHTPVLYGELCRPCYMGVLSAASGLETAIAV